MKQVSKGLYTALEEALKAASEPLDCMTLFDMPEIRQYASTANRVSDYLGNLWRKGDVVRLPAPKLAHTRSRWLYVWKGRTTKRPTLSEIQESAAFASDKVNTLLTRPNLEITQEGRNVIITLPSLTITIKQN